MNRTTLFEDIFEVRVLNEHGKKFDRVNRVHSKGITYDVDLVVDVNAELFDIRAKDRMTVALASTLSLDGTPDDGTYNPAPGPNLAGSYDYVMHGRVYLVKHIANQNIEVQASFGGLLMRLCGEQAQLEALSMDMTLFILFRKGGTESNYMDLALN